MRKATVQDPAALAGMSTATVDRVLHNRSGVSEKARERVRAAIHELGFGQLPGDLMEAPKRTLRFLFLLPKVNTSFAKAICTSVRTAARVSDEINVINDTQRIDLRDNLALIREIDAVTAEKYDGLALFAVDAPGVRQAIDRVVERGVKVVTLVSDIPTSKRHHFVGIDNVAAGRVAGTLMGRFAGKKKGTVGVIAGSLRMRDHVDRYFGFEQILRARFPGLRILPIEEGDSLHTHNAVITRRLLEKHDDLVGLYSAAAGNVGILEVLADLGKSDGLVVLMHELSEHTRRGLADGTVDAVINQDTGHIARSAVRVLTAFCSGRPIIEAQEKIRIDIYLADNLP
ncbi:LacI family DNA-binding transcriptional regulator [Hoeflea poritis]|uniref:LacI family DNA-binding transcriptional regulator n=1 Tax=Hoeflea poritis TaxID=2993659 RepID=A0ABT4VIP2_9HYPH|nr:LacI family DNA-binding transcriptional regulator [Hoeflea poritis]MDA4844556.1 LacI family DNA-binding transcriptional regulator [Hoeflea poritis]